MPLEHQLCLSSASAKEHSPETGVAKSHVSCFFLWKNMLCNRTLVERYCVFCYLYLQAGLVRSMEGFYDRGYQISIMWLRNEQNQHVRHSETREAGF